MTIETEPVASPATESPTRGIVSAAAILTAGNIFSRLLGLGREMVIAYLFGATGYVSVLKVAATLVITLYDLLVGGLVSAALVPVLSEYAADEKRRHEFWNLASVVLSVVALLLALAVLILELFAEPLFILLGAGYDETLRAVGVQMIRWILPAVFFIGIAGVLSGVLYARKKFTLPAFITAAFNLGIIVCALALTPVFGIMSVVLGVVVGAASQVVLQWLGLRNAPLRLKLDFRHPALKQIGRLYVPVLGGLCIAVVGVVIDRNLTSRTGDQSLAWMQAATYLVQLPLGLIATAISFAILPTLSRTVAVADFRKTLALGLKLVLLLILPAVVALYVLAAPVVEVVFQRGAFTADDTAATARALQFYLFGTAFAAIDQPLVFAFYARKNTLLPNLVAVVALGIYLAVAFLLIQPLGYLGLVLANSAQLAGHALVMLWFTRTRLGGIGGEGLGATTLKLLCASAAMGAALLVLPALNFGGSLVSQIVRVLVSALLGGMIYVLGLKLLRVRELDLIVGILQERLRRGRG